MLKYNNKSIKFLILSAIIFILGIVLFSFLIILTDRIVGTDDLIFQKLVLSYDTAIDWSLFRYQSWSGRIFTELFLYIFSSAPIILWKIVTIVMYAVFTVMIFLYYRLFNNHRNKQKDLLMMILAFCMPFLMHTEVLEFGMFWVTGAMNYFWIAAIGLVGFYPIAYYVSRHRIVHWPFNVLGIVALIIAACSQEQVGLILVGLSFIFLLYELSIYYKNRMQNNHKLSGSEDVICSVTGHKKKFPFPLYLLFITLIVIVSFSIGIFAPGNIVRIKTETIQWLPDFYTIPILQHIEYSYRWFLEATINYAGLLLTISWGLLALLFIKKQNKTKLQIVTTYLLILICLASLTKDFPPISYWFNYYATWRPKLPNMLSYITFVPWLVILIGTVFSPMILFEKQNKGRLLSILYLFAFTSIGLLTMSPTMYASGWRTVFVPSVILMLIAYLLIGEVIDKYTKYKYHLVIVIIFMAYTAYAHTALSLVYNILS